MAVTINFIVIIIIIIIIIMVGQRGSVPNLFYRRSSFDESRPTGTYYYYLTHTRVHKTR
jgi:hypothetical protein